VTAVSEESVEGKTAPSRSAQLLRAVGVFGATGIVIGSMIGSAIFIVPSEITREVGNSTAGLLVWVASGILSLFGALSYAELAGMMPQAGGQYIYLREAYGSLVSFLCGWMFFLAAQSGGIAAVSVGLSRYLGNFVAFSPWQPRFVAGGIIVVLSAINYRGIRAASRLQSVLTGIIVGMIVALITLGYALAHGPANAQVHALSTGSGLRFLGNFGVAMAAALWAFDGWNTVTLVAGEVRHPCRNIPLSLLVGTGVVIALYVGLNWFYYTVLTLPEIAGSSHVAADAATRILGARGSQSVALAIIISAFGSANSSILAGARVYYAMAKDRLFFGRCAAVHQRFHTPHVALVAQAIWSVFLVFLANYEQLFTFTVFAAWIFYTLTVLGVLVLRRKQPRLARPYQVFACPLIPVIFVGGALVFLINTLIQRPVESGWGCLFVALGIPMFLIWNRTTQRRSVSEGNSRVTAHS